MPTYFKVKRYVVETFEVVIDSPNPSREQILEQAEDPCDVMVLRETLRRVDPASHRPRRRRSERIQPS